MRPHQAALLVTLAVLAVLAALPLGKGKEEEGGAAALAEDVKNASSWPCCDKCGFCYLSYPPQCQCLDFSRGGCHPNCKDCIKFTADDDGSTAEPPVYRCADILTNFCERGCPQQPLAGILNAGSF